MPDRYLFEVTPVGEARAELAHTLDRFADAGPQAQPVVFGRHRKPEGVVLPYELFTAMLELYEQQLADRRTAEVALKRAPLYLDQREQENVVTFRSGADVDAYFDDLEARLDAEDQPTAAES